MPTYPQGPETGLVYTLTGPDGTVAVFNDDTSPDYVGSLTELSGLDSPELRENGGDLIEADGGWHGNFFHGRRPITLAGTILPTDVTDRNVKLTKLRRAARALRGNATLQWTPTGGISSFVSVRQQQPLRISGGFTKDYFLALVAANPRIQSSTLHTTTGILHNTPTDIDNQGDAPNYPQRIRINGPWTSAMTITNVTTGQALTLLSSKTVGQWVEVDFLNKTVVNNAGGNEYSTISFTQTAWWELQPGINSIKHQAFSAPGGTTTMDIDWRDAWL